MGGVTNRFDISMADGWLARVKVLEASKHILDLNVWVVGLTYITISYDSAPLTREIRSGIAHFPFLRNSRTFPLGSQDSTIQAF